MNEPDEFIIEEDIDESPHRSMIGRSKPWRNPNEWMKKTISTLKNRKVMFGIGGGFAALILFTIIIVTATKGTEERRGTTSDDTTDISALSKLTERFMKSVGEGGSGRINDVMMNLTRLPHLAGSEQDSKTASWVQANLTAWGFDVTVETYYVYINTPISRSVQLLKSDNTVEYNCTLKEDNVDDGTSSLSNIDTFNGYSASGDVTGKLVYANYGTAEDYEKAKTAGIDFTGTVVIVRYGRGFRGNKAQLAAKYGAVACLIYNDPSDWGYMKGTPYPDGPYGTDTTVQRGSLALVNGDPLTPGWASTENAPRYTIPFAQSDDYPRTPLPKIPVQPLGFKDAKKLLEKLTSGVAVPNTTWAGGQNLTFIGPGPNVRVNLKFDQVEKRPIWNVIGRMEGTTEPEKMIIIGAHRDAWVFGGVDPVTGTSILMEIAYSINMAFKNTSGPQRTIVIASWDAEEQGLIGSTEYAEHYSNLLSRQAVVYLNLDTAVTGKDEFNIKGSPSLKDIITEATKNVTLPTGKTVYDLWSSTSNYYGTLGSGSDYTALFQHLGIASVDAGFDAAGNLYQAVYHSNYDSYTYVSKFVDPTFEYHAALAKVYGYIALVFTNAPVFRFTYEDYADSLKSYVDKLAELSIAQGYGAEKIKPLSDAVEVYKNATIKLRGQITIEVNSKYHGWSSDHRGSENLNYLNERLMMGERSFLADKELSGDGWYKHVVYAPSSSDYYSSAQFPYLTQCIKSKSDQLDFVIGRTALLVTEAAHALHGWT